MSEPATPARPFYVTGGTLKPGEPSYVERRADTELYESLLAGEFCYVLTARQMGKSSLMARTAKRLEQAGVASAIVDLTQIGSERGDQAAAQWYFGIANKIHSQLRITAPLRPWWQERADLSSVQRLTDFFRELVLAEVPGRVVIFVDEIDSTIGLPFADDFFAALRACFNARATDDAFERLTFVLLGVATPDQLIQDPARTPFNIGKRIDLTDFRSDEAQVLEPGLHSDPGEAGRRLERVLHWTGGHPYLTQALCRAVRERGDTGTAEEMVDPQVEELFLSSRAQREETNLKHTRARLERSGPEGRRLLQLYRRVCQGKPVQDQPTSPLFAQLKLVGVVKAVDEGRLAVRNRIYEAVFTPKWARSAMPADRGRQLAAVVLAAAFATVLVWYAAYQQRPYEETFWVAIASDEFNAAFEAYTALQANPFSRSRAIELMQTFWEQRALRYASAGKRDESLLSYLQGLSFGESERLRRLAGNLVGPDYDRLRFTLSHAEGVSAVALSPDGLTLAIGLEDGTAQLWDTRTGKVSALLLNHDNAVLDIAFSPDGGSVVTGSTDKTAILWVSGVPSTPTLPHKDGVNVVAFSSDGATLTTGSWDNTVRLWDTQLGTPIGPHIQLQSHIFAGSFSLGGQLVATASEDNIVQLWDARSGLPITRPVRLQSRILTLTLSPDGQTLATGAADDTARLWDARSGKQIAPSLQHEGNVTTVAFSPDGRTLATGAEDNTARLWDVRSGEPIAAPLQLQGPVFSVKFSRDGRQLVAASRDEVRLWGTRSGKPPRPSFHEKGQIATAAFSPDGRTLATSFDDRTTLWDTSSGRALAPPLKHQGTVLAAAFSPDSQMLATGAEDYTARLWDARSGRSLSLPLRHQDYYVSEVVFSPDGQALATRDADYVHLWDLPFGKSSMPPLPHDGPVLSIAFSPDRRTLAAGAWPSTVRLWDARSGRSLAAPLQHKGFVLAMAFSPDGRTLATGTYASSSSAQLWDTHSIKPSGAPLQLQGVPQAIAFSPDGKTFFAAAARWLNTFSWNGKEALPQSSQLLRGFWKGFRFSSDCEPCLQVAVGDTGNSFHLETLRLDGPTDPPIEGDPKELLEKWQALLGLKFDNQMRPVPR